MRGGHISSLRSFVLLSRAYGPSALKLYDARLGFDGTVKKLDRATGPRVPLTCCLLATIAWASDERHEARQECAQLPRSSDRPQYKEFPGMTSSRVPFTLPGRPISGKLTSCSTARRIISTCFSAADGLSSTTKSYAAASCSEACLLHRICFTAALLAYGSNRPPCSAPFDDRPHSPASSCRMPSSISARWYS